MSGFKYIESGWAGYRHVVIPADASEVQVNESRRAFFAGAACLFETIMLAASPGVEPTEADMDMMANLQAEIDEFGQQLDLEILPAGGSA